MALRARHFLLSADALGPAVAAPTERNREEPRGSAEWEVGADTHIGNASDRRKGLMQVVRETRILQGISEPVRNVTGFLADLLRMCQV